MKKVLISKPNIDHKDLTMVNKAVIDGWGNNYLFYNNKLVLYANIFVPITNI